MTLQEIITETAAILRTVSNVGRVHAYRRAVNTDQAVLDIFKDQASSQIRAWEVTRETTARRDFTVGAIVERHLIVLRGYLSVRDADATEQTFQELIEAVTTAFLAKRDLNGKARETTPIQARLVGAATLGNILVHYCELVFEAEIYPVLTA